MSQIVLLIHDDAAKASTVRNSLLSSPDGLFIVEWVERCADGVRRLRKEGSTKRVAAVLVNLFLPDSHGIQTFDTLFLTSPEIPILVLSSLACEGSARLAVQRGAQDYLLDDDLHGYLLPKAVRNMIERTSNVEALFREKERAQVTLNSIGDAVVSTDIAGNVTFLNPIAAEMTGWSVEGAVGRSFEEVFQILDASSGSRVANPMTLVIQENQSTKLPPGCKLVRLDGSESAIEDSAAPIHDRRGSVTGAVMVFHDVTQAQAVSKKMSHLALHDYLTDLPNRLLLNDRLSQAISEAQRNEQKLAVLCIDIDRFKHVNDSLGQKVGDKLLLSVAARLVASVGSSDTVSRQGGDEFVILLSSVAHAEDAGLSAQKILSVVGMPHSLEEHTLEITVSAGIGIYPDDGTDAETLVKSANIAMLIAKNNGRNNYQFFKSNMNEHALERQSLESGLRRALDHREFELHYQGKVDLVTETLTGAEALIRWHPPGRDVALPKDFIPIAEQSGYIVPIGRWVLREACLQRRLWLDAKLAPIPIAINISAVELRSKQFVEHVRAILEETGLQACAHARSSSHDCSAAGAQRYGNSTHLGRFRHGLL